MKRSPLLGVALALTACGAGGGAGRRAAPVATPAAPSDAPRAPRAIVFRAPGFPSVDAPPIADVELDAGLAGLAVVQAATITDLAAALEGGAGSADVLVLPYGSAFPIDAWPALERFLAHGGGLANLGGAPLHVPVLRSAAGWQVGPRATTFAHALLVAPAEPARVAPGWTLAAAPPLPGLAGAAAAGTTTWTLTTRLTRAKSYPDEHGSAGPRDAVLRPLATLVDGAGTPRACPVLEIDNVRGERAGARWVFATTDAPLDRGAIHALVARALAGAAELRAVPERASTRDAPPAIRLERFRTPGPAHVVLRDAAGSLLRELDTADDRVELPGPLVPGLYRVDVRAGGYEATTGFWITDRTLLARGPALTVGRDWLRRDGAVFPVVGTTYMASDVHRDFLFEPNPAVWDHDFAEMQRRGVRFVRTGLWTAWSRVGRDGRVDEPILAALEAFVQTAARHDIVVCFNLFAFLPPAFGARNPWLDPTALARQEAFARAFAARFRDVPWIHWDLINEPSYAPPEKLWKTRPYRDPTEAAAFRAFVARRHPGLDDAALRALWRTPEPWAELRDDDLAIGAVQIDRAPRRAHDFRAFVEHTVAAWTARLAGALHDAGGAHALVTLGQDEGGIWERPLQQSFGRALDYTAVHTWWNNDDLLWDGVTTKLADRPNLHQETGLMRLEDLDGHPWRSPDAAARLLERKIGYAFLARGAGVVEWVWNENPYMPIDEESTIGLFRADGTAKPELDVLTAAARFFATAAPHLDDFAPEPVVLVLPHARVLLGAKGELAATRPVVRALAERFGIVPRAVIDQALRAEDLADAKLVVVPAPEVLDEPAAAALLAASRRGVKVLVTGPISGDAYGRPTPSLAALGLLRAGSRPVARHEATAWADGGQVTFDGLAQETVRRVDEPSRHFVAKLDVWQEPLPLELAVEREPLVALLDAALTAAGVTVPMRSRTDGVAVHVLVAPKAALVVAVNETAERATRRVTVSGRPLDVAVAAGRARFVLVDRATGRVLADGG